MNNELTCDQIAYMHELAEEQRRFWTAVAAQRSINELTLREIEERAQLTRDLWPSK